MRANFTYDRAHERAASSGYTDMDGRAWPAKYGETGVMTFIVSAGGQVYQKDLGPGTDAAARAMKSFEPDASWTKASP